MSQTSNQSLRALRTILRRAHAGELGAFLAYEGHWRSLNMAEKEWEHEQYFRQKVESHWLRMLVPLWSSPPPRHAIRQEFSMVEI